MSSFKIPWNFYQLRKLEHPKMPQLWKLEWSSTLLKLQLLMQSIPWWMWIVISDCFVCTPQLSPAKSPARCLREDNYYGKKSARLQAYCASKSTVYNDKFPCVINCIFFPRGYHSILFFAACLTVIYSFFFFQPDSQPAEDFFLIHSFVSFLFSANKDKKLE